MKVVERKNENHQEVFKFELEQAETDAAMQKAYEHLVKEVNVDGFRKGKAPRAVLEKQVGTDALFDHAMQDALPGYIEQIIAENQVKAYATPAVRLTSREPVTVEAVIPLPPDITLGDYNSIKMKPNPVSVEDKAVDDVLERIQHQAATWEEVTTSAELNDGVVMDIESDIDGVPYVIEKGANLQLMADMRFPAQNFSEQIVGMKAGEERDFNIKIPEDSADKDRAGKEVHFKVKVHDIRREKLPEFDDEFAKKVIPGCENRDQVREKIKSDIMQRAQANENASFEQKVIDELVSKSQIAFPPLLTDNEVERMMREYVDRVRSSVRSEEEFNSILNSTSPDKLRQTYHPQAEQRVKRNLVISKLVEDEKIEAADEEIDLHIAAITANAGDKVEEQTAYFNKPENRESICWWLKANKARKLLVDKAQAE